MTASFAIAEHSTINPVQGRLDGPQQTALVLPQAHRYDCFQSMGRLVKRIGEVVTGKDFYVPLKGQRPLYFGMFLRQDRSVGDELALRHLLPPYVQLADPVCTSSAYWRRGWESNP